jgi:hypothetical protein
MKSIFIILSLLVGVLPVIVIIFLFNYYKVYINLKKKNFENSGCVVLNRDKIGDILEHSRPSEYLRIFKSAICDHSLVEGIRYFTNFPFGQEIIIGHDNHRKSFIAHEIGQILTRGIIISDGDMELCADILIRLTDKSQETYYTQLIVWNSMSKLARFQKKDLVKRIGIDYLKDSIAGDFIIGIGVLKFIFNLKSYKDLDDELENIVNDIIFHAIEKGSRNMVAPLVFKLSKSPYFDQAQKRDFMESLPYNIKFNTFLKYLKNLDQGFLQEELSEGLKSLGLQSPPYSKYNTEGEIVQFLLKDFLEEIYVSASYMLYTFNKEEHRNKFLNFLWF